MKFLTAVLAALLFSLGAHAQTGPFVSQGPTPTQGSSGVCAVAPAINTQSTCTINVPGNQHAYINYLSVTGCSNATASSAVQQAFTSTNLNGWTAQISVSAATSLPTCVTVGGARAQPMMSSAGPVTVTVVTPAAATNISWSYDIEYYLAQ